MRVNLLAVGHTLWRPDARELVLGADEVALRLRGPGLQLQTTAPTIVPAQVVARSGHAWRTATWPDPTCEQQPLEAARVDVWDAPPGDAELRYPEWHIAPASADLWGETWYGAAWACDVCRDVHVVARMRRVSPSEQAWRAAWQRTLALVAACSVGWYFSPCLHGARP